MSNDILLSTVYLPNNQGHGNARRLSFEKCKNNLVAIMDSDDISLPRRFELQLQRFAEVSDASVVGGQIVEFIGSRDNLTGMRAVPCEDKEIKSFMRRRCPMNQVSVMLKKADYDYVGGYVDWHCEEDYYLWLRMAKAGFKFANCSEPLVLVRIGDQMSSRRGGWKYFHSEERLQRFMLNEGVISFPRYILNTSMRLFGELLITDKARTHLFKMLRSRVDVSKVEELTTLANQEKPSNSEYPPFSVAMCVYAGDNAAWFDEAIASVVNQTVPPNEIVIVVDGPIPDGIQDVIGRWTARLVGGGH